MRLFLTYVMNYSEDQSPRRIELDPAVPIRVESAPDFQSSDVIRCTGIDGSLYTICTDAVHSIETEPSGPGLSHADALLICVLLLVATLLMLALR